MARYFFHLWTGVEHYTDDEGSDLDGAEAAYLEAFETAQDLILDLVRGRQDFAKHRFDVVDEEGRLIHQLRFTEVLRTRAARHPLLKTVERGRALTADLAEQVEAARRRLAVLRQSSQRRF